MSSLPSNNVRVGLMGATGMVGTEMLRILEERNFPVGELRAYASPRSEGRKLPFRAGDVVCDVLRPGCFDGLDLVVIDVEDDLALEWAPQAVAAGALVVDNSAAFRMDPDVPVVVAEVNPEDLSHHRAGDGVALHEVVDGQDRPGLELAAADGQADLVQDLGMQAGQQGGALSRLHCRCVAHAINHTHTAQGLA